MIHNSWAQFICLNCFLFDNLACRLLVVLWCATGKQMKGDLRPFNWGLMSMWIMWPKVKLKQFYCQSDSDSPPPRHTQYKHSEHAGEYVWCQYNDPDLRVIWSNTSRVLFWFRVQRIKQAQILTVWLQHQAAQMLDSQVFSFICHTSVNH